jgi:hypothetical protein
MKGSTVANQVRERNAKKALERSLRNQPPGFKPRRRQKRLAAIAGVSLDGGKVGNTPVLTRSALERMNKGELQKVCEDRKIKFTTRQKKADLIEMIAGR